MSEVSVLSNAAQPVRPRLNVLQVLRSLLTPQGKSALNTSTLLCALTGLLEGLAMLAMLPLSSALMTGQPSWGLNVAGWLWILVVLAALGAVVRYVEAITGYAVGTDFLRGAHEAIGNRLARLPLGWFTRSKTGKLSRLVSDKFMAAGSVVVHILPGAISNTVTLVTLCCGAWLWNWRLGLALTLSLPLALALMLVAQWIRRQGIRPVIPTAAEVAARMVEFAACQPALRAAGRSDDYQPLQEALAVNDRAQVRELWLSTLGLLLNNMALQTVLVILIVLCASLATQGTLGPVSTIVFIGLALRFTRNFQALGNAILGMETAREPLQDTQDIVSAAILPEAEQAAPLPTPGQVRFEHVNFSYEPGHPVLRDLNFVLEPGSMTAVVGPSGSGKSTIARLIARFWEVDSGRILVGGTDIRDLPTEQLMAQLAMVFQDVYLFDDTLEANIRVGRPDASPAEVQAAAEQAGVTELVSRLPQGWETRVGEGGRSLSGGERQRVSIARALLKQAPIVLFDEATSALDSANETNILGSMEKLRQNATLLVIAHKLDTIRAADRIIVLNANGEIAESGTHTELYAGHQLYRRLWNRREAATGWSLIGR